VWARSEYSKLPQYDEDTPSQPFGLFLCHQQDGRVCAGWAGCHDMTHSLALRLAASDGRLSAAEINAILDYESPIELFSTGAEAAAHGEAAIEIPDTRARRTIGTLVRKQERRA
jgi:hypothetical protein